MKNNKVAIILPNFNSSEYLKKTLKSVLNQSYKNWQLIIVDDASNKKTIEILKKFKKHKKIKIFFLKKNMGAGYCRNYGIRNSKSDYLAFIDSDDTWKKEKLKNQLEFMKKNNHEFTYTDYFAFYKKKNKKRKVFTPKKISYEEFIRNTSIATSTMMIKRRTAKNIFFTNTKICEDYFFKCKILEKVKYAFCLNKLLTTYMIRNDSLQSSKIKNLLMIWKINSQYNKFKFLKNITSLINISLNSILKYGFK